MKSIRTYLLLLCVLGLGACGDDGGVDKSELDNTSFKEVSFEFRLDAPFDLEAPFIIHCLRYRTLEDYSQICEDPISINTITRIRKFSFYIQKIGLDSKDESLLLVDRVEIPLSFSITPQHKPQPSYIRGLTYPIGIPYEGGVFSFVVTKIIIEGEVEVIDEGPSFLNPIRDMDNFEIEGKNLPWVYEYNACRSAPNCASRSGIRRGERVITFLNSFEYINSKIVIHINLTSWLRDSLNTILSHRFYPDSSSLSVRLQRNHQRYIFDGIYTTIE